MQEFSHNDDAESIMLINCFYSCIESRYALGMLTFHSQLKDRGINVLNEDLFKALFRNAGTKYEHGAFKKFKQALAIFQYMKQHPLFKEKVVEQIRDTLSDYEQTLNQIFESGCDPESGICEVPNCEEIDQTYLKMKRQEIVSGVRFLKDDVPFDIEEKLTLLGFI